MPYHGDTNLLEPPVERFFNGDDADEPAASATLLMPNSAIQFLMNSVASEITASVNRRFFEDTSVAPESEGAVLYSVKLEDDGSFHHPVSHHVADVRQTYAIDGASALEAFSGNWIPVPFMRVLADEDGGPPTLDEGPSNWTRVFITRAEGDVVHSHRVVLAVDTTCCAKQRVRGRTVAAPTVDDARDGGLFRFSDDEADIAWFVTEAWVDDWLREVFAGREDARDQDREPDERQPSALEYLGHYLTLLAVLKDSGVLPDIELKALGDPGAAETVAVDLVLDIGNSRTCAILSEPASPSSVKAEARASLLVLRDFDQPWLEHAGLFASRIEFSRASFGKESLSRWSGRTNAFYWPSLVRVGPEAQRLVAQSHTTTDVTGLSGPMRYLWDDAAGEQPWRFARTVDNAARRRVLVSGPLLGFVSETGDLITDEDRTGATTKPRFSRSSLLTFFGNEILLQAIVAINGPRYRAKSSRPDLPRRLDRILLTVPAGMRPRERQIVEGRLQAAVRLTWQGLQWTGAAGAPPMPMVSIVEDNATNAQTAYLHNEIQHKFRGKASEYFDLMGKARPGHRTVRAIRVASLDIGGGTTGLSISNYELHQANGLMRTALALDGFPVGGDDILKRIVERHIMVAIERGLSECKLGKPKRFLEDVICGTANGRPSWIGEFGRRFASEFAMPVALALLNECRGPQPAGDDIIFRRTFRHLLETAEFVPKAVIEEFDELAADEGADGFSLLDAEIDLRHRDLKQTVGAVLDPLMANAVRIIEALDCDLVLLSGWTTCLPPVIDALLGGLATQPNRIVPMHGLRVQSWYPHLDETGTKIADAKSAAAVGALLSSRKRPAGYDLDFVISTGPAGAETRRLFVGRVNPEGLLKNDAIMFVFDEASGQANGKAQNEAQCTVKVELPALIGARRLAVERWPASPLFVIDLSDANGDRPKMPVEVTLERVSNEAGLSEDLRIVKARDGHGSSLPPTDLELKLQTLATRGGHWFDTGAIVIA